MIKTGKKELKEKRSRSWKHVVAVTPRGETIEFWAFKPKFYINGKARKIK